MKVTVPENISDIELGKFQAVYDFVSKTDNEREIEDFTLSTMLGIKEKDVSNISEKDRKELLSEIKKAMDKEMPFTKTFTLRGVEYGFIPNLDKITGNEFLDIKGYEKEVTTYHSLMAVLFRKVTNKDVFGNYVIEPYDGTAERAELFREMPMNIVNGALGFFFRLSEGLQSNILRYTARQRAKGSKRQPSLQSGDGTLHSKG